MFHPLKTSSPLPQRFTFPFCYEPDGVTLQAATTLQGWLEERDDWHEEIAKGKMFGVMVVEKTNGEVGFLCAYSGQIGGKSDWPGFVPAILDYLQPDGHFKTEEANISAINHEISRMEHSENLLSLLSRREEMAKEFTKELSILASFNAERKQQRNRLRAEGHLTPEKEADMIRESQFDKAEMRRMKKRHQEALERFDVTISPLKKTIEERKKERKQRSEVLQRWLFASTIVANGLGERRNLSDIFAPTPQHLPPSGAGECCAPKLLQWALLNGMRPVSMAEFWWGASPKDEVRHHLSFYPACEGKCRPILSFMLKGIDVDDDPLQRQRSRGEVNIVYEDTYLVCIEKPSGMLSVRGKNNTVSAEEMIQQQRPNATIKAVHRLDMDTSGLLLLAKDTATHAMMQSLFRSRKMKKQYRALLLRVSEENSSMCKEGTNINNVEGRISLPLSPDYDNRPRQRVDFSSGKPSETLYRIDREYADGTLLVTFTPLTGRTHQLRVHAAHAQGMNAPIVGDRLYAPTSRYPFSTSSYAPSCVSSSIDTSATVPLHLHASHLEFLHPMTGEHVTIESQPKGWIVDI